ncbi:MAG: hypothetical protein WA081_13230 [Desulfosalsimonadaceae bacterium]
MASLNFESVKKPISLNFRFVRLFVGNGKPGKRMRADRRVRNPAYGLNLFVFRRSGFFPDKKLYSDPGRKTGPGVVIFITPRLFFKNPFAFFAASRENKRRRMTMGKKVEWSQSPGKKPDSKQED